MHTAAREFTKKAVDTKLTQVDISPFTIKSFYSKILFNKTIQSIQNPDRPWTKLYPIWSHRSPTWNKSWIKNDIGNLQNCYSKANLVHISSRKWKVPWKQTKRLTGITWLNCTTEVQFIWSHQLKGKSTKGHELHVQTFPVPGGPNSKIPFQGERRPVKYLDNIQTKWEFILMDSFKI